MEKIDYSCWGQSELIERIYLLEKKIHEAKKCGNCPLQKDAIATHSCVHCFEGYCEDCYTEISSDSYGCVTCGANINK